MEIKKYIPYPEIRKKVALRAVGLAVIAASLCLTSGAIPVSSQSESLDLPARQENPQWSLDAISNATPDKPFDQAFTYTATGRGVTIAIVDSGVNDHEDFKDENGNSRLTVKENFVEGQGPEDCNAHGTYIAGIAAGTTWGVAKEATIASYKVFDCDKSIGY